jgi:hypothetical protein
MARTNLRKYHNEPTPLLQVLIAQQPLVVQPLLLLLLWSSLQNHLTGLAVYPDASLFLQAVAAGAFHELHVCNAL